MSTEPATDFTTGTLDERTSFSRVVPKLQIAWDSVSLGALKKCPRYYQLSIIEGWRKTRGSSNVHFRFGILYHRALEVYDHKKFEGMDHEAAMTECLIDLAHGCMDGTKCETCDGQGQFVEGKNTCPTCHESPKPGSTEPWTLWDPEEGMDEDKASKNNKNIYTLFRSVVWYLERFGKHDPIETVRLANGKPAVELSFRFNAGFASILSGEEYLLSGHLDRLGKFGGQVHVVDRKTSSSTLGRYFFDQFSPNGQMSGYTLAGRVVLETPVAGVIIDAAQIARGFTAFERGIATRSEGQLEEWLADTQHWINLNERFVKLNYWPTNDTSCNDYGGCIFRGICSKDPRVREQYLKSEYHTDKWDPLKVRGDI